MIIQITPLDMKDPSYDKITCNRITITIHKESKGRAIRVKYDHDNGFGDLITINDKYVVHIMESEIKPIK